MKYCSDCGSNEMNWTVPSDDNRPRHVCSSCETIFYQNPKIVAGCIPVWEDQILLCKRAIEPRHGYWTLPAGFMENAETTFEAAERETREEANAEVENLDLFTVLNIPHTSQVYMMFRSQLRSPDFSPGVESLECKMFREDEIPWRDLAFPTIVHTLKFFFEDRKQNDFKLHAGDIVWGDGRAEYFHRRDV
jgi:ADP-ribose pyrophosphatase YjhB (NUDIX family)